jgi:ectoine hydroxylase-related dioxygenase (phytanoyl-CoA dioxygenase family)
MDMSTALAELGAHAHVLTTEQRRQLTEQGYLVLPGIIGPEWLAALRERFEELVQKEGALAGTEVHTEPGTRRLSNLVNKGAVFDGIYTHPLVLAAIRHVIGREFKLSSLNARDALPGAGLQGLHADWGRGYDGRFHVCNSIWLLDDMDEGNGCTRLVPGTQYIREPIGQACTDVKAPHPQEIKLIAPAGTVCVFNSHVWHGGTKNVSTDRPRRACHCYFTAREHPQQTYQQQWMLLDTWKRLSPAARYILDVDVELPAASGRSASLAWVQ